MAYQRQCWTNRRFSNPNPVHTFYWVIRTDPNPVVLSKYMIQSSLCPKKKLLLSNYCSECSLDIHIWSGRVFSKSSPIRVRFWIAHSGWITIRKPDHVQHWPEMITMRFTGWISGRIVSLQPDTYNPKIAFNWQTDTDIRNAFIDISRIQTFGKSCT